MNNISFSQINFSKIFNQGYIFEKSPNPNGYYVYLSIIFGLFLLTGIWLAIIVKRKEKIFQRLYSKIINLCLVIGISGLILIFCRYEGISYLGSRLMLIILTLVFLIWIILISWYRLMNLPKEVESDKKRKNFEKYLP